MSFLDDNVYVWLSNLQKMIRRSKELEALASVYILHEDYSFQAYKRVCLTILSEDLGIAGNVLLPKAKTIYDTKDFKGLTELVSYMTMLPKSRLTDLLIHFNKKPDNFYTIEEWFTEKKSNIPLLEILKSFSYYAIEVHECKKRVSTDLTKYGDKKRMKYVYSLWETILNKSTNTPFYQANIILMYFYSKNTSEGILHLIQAGLNLIYYYQKGLTILELPTIIEKEFDISDVKPDDIAYDKHTAKGKQMKRGIRYFYNVGSLISPQFDLCREEEDEIKNSLVNSLKNDI